MSLDTGLDYSIFAQLGNRFALLTDVARLLIRETDLDVLANAVADRMQGFVEFARFAIALPDPSGLTYHIRTCVERREGVGTEAITGVPTGFGVIGRAMSTGRPTYVPDVEAVALSHADPSTDDLRTYLVVPLKGNDGVLGALAMGALRPHAFTETEIRGIRQLADMLALAVERENQMRLSHDMRLALAEKSDRLEATVGRLQTTNLELDTFIYSASHDLRAPLLSIAGLTDLARLALSQGQADELGDYLDRIARNVRKLDTVVVDILQVSRANRMEKVTQAVHLPALIGEVVELLAAMDDAGTVDIDVRCGVGVRVVLEKRRLRQVLTNLISNGIKYRDLARDDAYVRVSCRRDGEQLEIRVEDNGIGIPANLRGRVFEMFFRASSQSFGSGLGLYLVRQHAEAMGGTVALLDQPVGTCIQLRIPVFAETDTPE